MLAVSVLTGVMQTVTERLLRDDGPADLDADQVAQVVRAAFSLRNPSERGRRGRACGTAGFLKVRKPKTAGKGGFRFFCITL